jgi:hypothetical protein
MSAAFVGSGAFSVILANENQAVHAEATVNIEPPAEIKALIKSHIVGFNAQNNEMLLSVFGETAIVVDGTLTVTAKGQAGVRKGTFACTFSRVDRVWKIEAQACGRTA